MYCQRNSSSSSSFFFQAPAHLTIRCARVAGVEIPNAKRIEYSLQYVHGIGRTKARQILLSVGLENKVTRDLSEEELTLIREEITKNPQDYKVEGDLVKLWFALGSY